MNKLFRIISIILAAVMLFGMTAASAAERDIVPAGLCLEPCNKNVTAVITFSNGSEYTANGAVDLTATERNPIIENIKSIGIIFGDEIILTVEPKDLSASGASSPASNGYYTVDFMLPDSEKECFISGMSAKKAESIQDAIISAWTESTGFVLEDVDFIDAEKLGYEAGDSQLCWAGTVSNMLQFTGWGEQAGFRSEDDLFDIFPQHFDDEGYFAGDGIRWFFDGTKSTRIFDKIQIRDYPDSGRYLPDYDVNSLCSEYSLKAEVYTENMKRLTDDMRAGHAVGLSVITDISNAHAITCWGFVTDNSYQENEAQHYVSLIVADSDDDKEYGREDRRTAPNKLNISPINRFEDDEGMYYSKPSTVYRSYCGALRDFTSLAPYSDDIPKETDPDATKNRTNTIDLIVGDASAANSPEEWDFASDTVGKGNVTLFFHVTDFSDIDFMDYADVRVTIYKNGEKIRERTKNCFIKGIQYFHSRQNIDVGELNEGSYIAEITVNPEKSLSEAYYMNNTFRYEFSVIPPEYDSEEMSLSVETEDQPAANQLKGTVGYEGVPEDLLRGAEKAELQVAQYEEGETASYSSLYQETYSEINPLLPEKISFNKIGPFIRFKLTLLYRGVIYNVFSPEYTVRSINIYIGLTENNTPRKSPLPYGSTQFNEGEQLAFRLENRSWNWDSDLIGTYTLICADPDEKEKQLSDPVAFSLKKGELSQEITIRSWDEPADNSGNLYLVFEGESDGVAFRYRNYLSEIKVVEPKSTAVTMSRDNVDPYDGKISMREAIVYARELGAEEITISEETDKITLDNTLIIDGSVVISGDKNRKITVGTDGQSPLFDIVPGGELSLSGLFISSENKSGTDGGFIVCEGGKVNVSDCRLNYITSYQKGAMLYMDGGTALMKNCSSEGSESQDGTIAYITGGARAEILNCTFDSAVSYGTLIHNVNGSLNLINSTLMSSYALGGPGTIVKSEEEAQTNIVNCIILGNRGKYDAAGSVKLFSTAYNQLGEQASADELCRVYKPAEIFMISPYGIPKIENDENSLYILPELKKAAAEGSRVTEKNGVLHIGKDTESMSSVGVMTSFTAEDLAFDIVGNQRQAVYGSYSVYSKYPILGDADEDGEVTILDATLIQRFDAKMISLSDDSLIAADVDRDGEVTVIDATRIQRYTIGMKAPEGIGKPIS